MNELKRTISGIFKELELVWINSFEQELNQCKKEQRKFSASNIMTEVLRKTPDVKHKMDIFFQDAEERIAKKYNTNKKGMFSK